MNAEINFKVLRMDTAYDMFKQIYNSGARDIKVRFIFCPKIDANRVGSFFASSFPVMKKEMTKKLNFVYFSFILAD